MIGSSLSKYRVYEGGLIKGSLVVKRWEPLDYMISKMKIHGPSEELWILIILCGVLVATMKRYIKAEVPVPKKASVRRWLWAMI